MIRKTFACAFMVFSLSLTSATAAPPRPDAKKDLGVIVLALDDFTYAPEISSRVYVTTSWFDSKNKVPYVEGDTVGLSSSAFKSKVVTTKSGRSYLVSRAYTGRAAILMVTVEAMWEMCLNNGTASFYVLPGKFTYLGHFSFVPSRQLMAQAVRAGKMPATIGNRDNVRPLRNERLVGFTPFATAPTEFDQVQTDLNEIYGETVDVSAGDISATNYEVFEDTNACFKKHSPKERPQGFDGFKQ
jgi:hypothetical protein